MPLGLTSPRIGLIVKACRLKPYLRSRIFQAQISIQCWLRLVKLVKLSIEREFRGLRHDLLAPDRRQRLRVTINRFLIKYLQHWHLKVL